jgi:hypothetical protein
LKNRGKLLQLYNLQLRPIQAGRWLLTTVKWFTNILPVLTTQAGRGLRP